MLLVGNTTDVERCRNIAATGAPGACPVMPGSFTILTAYYAIMSRRLQLTGALRATLQGTARLRIT